MDDFIKYHSFPFIFLFMKVPPPNRRHAFRHAKCARQTFMGGGVPPPGAWGISLSCHMSVRKAGDMGLRPLIIPHFAGNCQKNLCQRRKWGRKSLEGDRQAEYNNIKTPPLYGQEWSLAHPRGIKQRKCPNRTKVKKAGYGLPENEVFVMSLQFF